MASEGRRCSLAFLLLLAAAAAGALAFRLTLLDNRPMHPDEANQAVKTGRLCYEGTYRYDPEDHHGPTLYYLALPSIRLSGAGSFAETTERDYRVLPALFGAGLVLLLLLVAGGLGRPAALCSAVLTCVSPAMVYYSRFYIHEMLLVFFTFALIGAGWRYVKTRAVAWALIAGAFAGLMHATKETCVIVFAAMLAALLLTVASHRRGRANADTERAALNWRHLLAAVLAACAVSALFFSSFLSNPEGPLDSIRAYLDYARRGAGESLHVHPWHYYLGLLACAKDGALWWSEGLILALALAGAVAALSGRGLGDADARFVRFIALYTVFITAAYSIIPHKTPWCMLGFLHGMILLAGIGAVALVRLAPRLPAKIAVSALVLAGALHLGWQAHQAAFRYPADPRNPYAYAQTLPDMDRLADRVEELAAFHPEGRAMRIHVIAPPHDTWPLPWVLRRFERVGYWTEVPKDADAAVVITSAGLREAVEKNLNRRYQPMHYGLRPGVLLAVLVDRELWEKFLGERATRGFSPVPVPGR